MYDTKHLEITARIAAAIRDGRYHDKLPPLRELRLEYEVSLQTIHKAVKPLVAAGVIVPGARGSVIHSASLAAPERETHHALGFVGYHASASEQQPIFKELSTMAAQHGYALIGIRFDQNFFKNNPGYLLKFPVDGFLFHFSSLRKEQEPFLRRAGIPFVTGAKWWGVNADKIVQCDADLSAGYRMLFRHLRAAGCRRIAYVDYERVREYRAFLDYVRGIFMRELGDAFDPELFFVHMSPTRYLEQGEDYYYHKQAELVFKRFFDRAIPAADAVVTNRAICRHLLPMLKASGRRVPDDVALATIDTSGTPDRISGVFFDVNDRLRWGMTQLLALLEKQPLASRRCNQQPVWCVGETVLPPDPGITTDLQP